MTGDQFRILVAEDDEDFLGALEIWLSDYGDAEILTVTDGRAALGALDSTIDVFLCDLRMPNLTGTEVIERMAREDYDVPTVVISAYEPDFHDLETYVDGHLSKPFDRKQLLEVVDGLLTT